MVKRQQSNSPILKFAKQPLPKQLLHNSSVLVGLVPEPPGQVPEAGEAARQVLVACRPPHMQRHDAQPLSIVQPPRLPTLPRTQFNEPDGLLLPDDPQLFLRCPVLWNGVDRRNDTSAASKQHDALNDAWNDASFATSVTYPNGHGLQSQSGRYT